MAPNILHGPSDEEFKQVFDELSVFSRLEKFLEWGYDKKFYPTDQEIVDVLEALSAQEILNETIKYELADLGLKMAVDKGLLNNMSPNQILIIAIKSCSLKYVQYAIDLGADINYIDENGLAIKTLKMNDEIRNYLQVNKS